MKITIWRCSAEKIFLKISYNSQETTCFAVYFAKFIRIFFFYRPPPVAASVSYCSKSFFFGEVPSDFAFNLDFLIMTLYLVFSRKKISSRIYNVRRSSSWFKAISFLTVSVDLLLALDIFSCINGFLIKVDTVSLQSILVGGTLVIRFKWYSATLNINMKLY